MEALEYVRPENLGEALAFLGEKGQESRIIAGGTDLLVEMRKNTEDFSSTKYILDISNLLELHFLQDQGDRIIFGPLMTYGEILDHEIFLQVAPSLCRRGPGHGFTADSLPGHPGGKYCQCLPCSRCSLPSPDP